MIARLWIKHRENSNSQGVTKGDIVEVLPREADPGKLVYRSFYPMDVDINIPCGIDFKPPYKCKDCVNNHPDTCDVRKLKIAEWSGGSVLDPPKVVKARVYGVDLKNIIPEKLETIAYKEDKTKQEKKAIKLEADSTSFSKDIIIDKTKVAIKEIKVT